MGESTNKKGIYVTLDRDLHKKAVLNDVNWCRAFEVGVKLVLGDNREEQELIKVRDELKGRVKHIENRLSEMTLLGESASSIITKINNGEKIQLGINRYNQPRYISILDYLKECSTSFKKNKGLLGPRTRGFNNKLGSKLSDMCFNELCERADAGEFDSNGAEHKKGGKHDTK